MTLGNQDPPTPPESPQSNGRTVRLVVAGILLAIPVVALMAVPTYSKTDPTLWGFPFFFWYQFLWVFLCAGFTYSAYRVTLSAGRKERDR